MNTETKMNIAKGFYLIAQIEKLLSHEQWVVVREFPNFAVSNQGRVINLTTGNAPKLWKDPKGYALVRLKNDSRELLVALHHLVAFTFIENDCDLPCVDHINNDPNDNRVVNLRWCTQQQNCWNRTKHVNTTSKYKGVTWNKLCNKWIAQIGYNGKVIYIGLFKDEKDAGRAYNVKAKEMFGEFAKLNIID